VGRTARLAGARIETGALNGDGSLESLARELGLSSRQLRRAIRQEYGVSPVELAQTCRLLLAKKLIAETSLPLIEVALASGFASVRRFNALFRSHYSMTPSHMRRASGARLARETLTLALAYRPPLAWEAMLHFMAGRVASGVESVTDRSYERTVRLGEARGWVKVERSDRLHALRVEVSTSLARVLPALLARLRCLFDLDARPDLIAEQLSVDPVLARAISALPGLRVPGCVDGFEMAVRAILGQRISVPAATTLAGRLAAAFGEPIETPFSSLCRLSPTPERLARVEPEELIALGVAAPRARAIRELARAVVDRLIVLEPGADPDLTIERLKQLPGIGDWTAHYIAMRALRWPDAFPAADLGLLRASGALSPAELARRAERWRPWRSYAAIILWNSRIPLPPSELPIHGQDRVLPSPFQPAR
jgi:AraC family transcriptional regulator of adaptative response / DNA-3-methyladenine glycosylase II